MGGAGFYMMEAHMGMPNAYMGVRAGFPEGVQKANLRQDLGLWHRKSDGRTFITCHTASYTFVYISSWFIF